MSMRTGPLMSRLGFEELSSSLTVHPRIVSVVGAGGEPGRWGALLLENGVGNTVLVVLVEGRGVLLGETAHCVEEVPKRALFVGT